MFVSLASDMLLVLEKNKKHLLTQKEIIDNAPKLFTHLAKKNQNCSVYVLTGPGSFTTLKTGSLLLNTLKTIKAIKWDFFCCNKIVFFKTLVENKFLPTKGIIWIGQKKNMRFYDFKKNAYKIVTKDEITTCVEKKHREKTENTEKNLQNQKYPGVFVEGLYEEKLGKPAVSIESYDEGGIKFSFQGKQKKYPLDLFYRKKTDLIIPDYMIDPI